MPYCHRHGALCYQPYIVLHPKRTAVFVNFTPPSYCRQQEKDEHNRSKQACSATEYSEPTLFSTLNPPPDTDKTRNNSRRYFARSQPLRREQTKEVTAASPSPPPALQQYNTRTQLESTDAVTGKEVSLVYHLVRGEVSEETSDLCRC